MPSTLLKNPKKEVILTAAMQILQEQGVKKLSQARVAAAAGMRQSHLTYYFPKKTDLIAGLLQQHIDSAEVMLQSRLDGQMNAGIQAALEMLVSNQPRMRFFLALLIEADESEEIKDLLTQHIHQFSELVGRFFSRDANDLALQAFINSLRGYGIVNMLSPENCSEVDVQALAKTFGLS